MTFDVANAHAHTLRVALITLGDPGRLTGGYLYHLRMAELAPRNAARVDFVSFPERPFPLAAFAAGSVARRLREFDPHAILLDSIAAAFYAPWLRLRHPGVPVVAILHQPPGGIDHGAARALIQAWLDRLAYARAERLLVASQALAAELVACGVDPERLRVVAPGRDVASAPEAAPGDLRRARSAALLCVGNWVRRKGILTLVEAFAALPETAATLHLVGDDSVEPEYAAEVRSRLARPDLAGRVEFHGKLSRGAVAAMYEAADAFVLPSLKEPYGTVYGEAMAAGLPVVGWRAGNLPHLAEDGREGLIVEPGDVRALTEAIGRLSCDEPFRKRLGEAARRRALSFPTWDEAARLLFSSLREVLAGYERPQRERCDTTTDLT